MPKQLTEDHLRKVYSAVEKAGSVHKAAKNLRMPRSTLINQLKQFKNRNVAYEGEVEFIQLPSSNASPEEIIEQACKRFTNHKTARDARKWMPIKLNTDKPVGICFMGDPHVDAYGCNWPLLKRDISILEKTDGMYAVNLGDLTDNWVGRLMRLYADSEMSKKDAWKLAKYILRDCKIKWLCHILGNHDLWNDGAALIKANAHPFVPVEEWQSKFEIVFRNDVGIRVNVAHDFPGTSIWNEMHGPKKASMLFDQAHIYACGHKHQWAVQEGENAHRDYVYWLIRSRGYKFIDNYADVRGYGSQQYGASVTAIIDPKAVGPRQIRCFPDLEEAADFLNYKRRK